MTRALGSGVGSMRRPSSSGLVPLPKGFGIQLTIALTEGLRPSDSPTRSLASRFAGTPRSRGSLAALARDAGVAQLVHQADLV